MVIYLIQILIIIYNIIQSAMLQIQQRKKRFTWQINTLHHRSHNSMVLKKPKKRNGSLTPDQVEKFIHFTFIWYLSNQKQFFIQPPYS